MRILVTGASGFTAGPLRELLESDPSQEVHLTDLRPSPLPRYHSCDLTDTWATWSLLEETQPDRVYHLAGSFSNEFPKDFPANVITTQTLLDGLVGLKSRAKVLLVGSAAEYGQVEPGANPLPESTPLTPVSVYGLTKSLQTHCMAYFHRRGGVDVRMARTFNLTGTGLSEALLPGRLARLIARVKSGEEKRVELGSLEGCRDFLPVEEAVAAYRLVMEKAPAGKIVHVASGRPTQLRDFVASELGKAGLSMDLVDEKGGAAAPFTVRDIWADIRKLTALGGKERFAP